jgi:type I restriction enzyme, R subunit
VRRLIINESPVDPAYYDKMSKLLDALIAQRRKGVVSYREYLEKIAALTKQATTPGGGHGGYPAAINTAGKRALYNNLGNDATLTLAVDASVQNSRQDGWRTNAMKTRRVRTAIIAVLTVHAKRLEEIPPNTAGATTAAYAVAAPDVDAVTDRVLELVRHQNEY